MQQNFPSSKKDTVSDNSPLKLKASNFYIYLKQRNKRKAYSKKRMWLRDTHGVTADAMESVDLMRSEGQQLVSNFRYFRDRVTVSINLSRECHKLLIEGHLERWYSVMFNNVNKR